MSDVPPEYASQENTPVKPERDVEALKTDGNNAARGRAGIV